MEAGAKRRSWRTLVFLLAFAGLLRGALLAAQWPNLHEDPDAYRILAETWRQTGVFGLPAAAQDGEAVEARPTAFRPPLYPLLLAALVDDGRLSSFAVAGLHLCLGVGTVWLVWIVTQTLRLGGAGAIAAVMVACDPILLNQSSLVMTETLATFLAAAVWAAVVFAGSASSPRLWHWALIGVLTGLACLCRPTFLIWSASLAVLPWLPASNFGGARTRRLALTFAYLLTAAITLAPWAARNWRIYGRPIVATTHGGYTLHLANNPSFYRHLLEGEWGQTWDAKELNKAWAKNVEPKIVGSGAARELAQDRLHYEAARQTIESNFPTFIWSCVVRAGRLWRPAPHRLQDEESIISFAKRMTIGAWYLGIYLLAGWGAVRHWGKLRARPWLAALFLALSLTALHAIYWSNMRMRAPVMPIIYALAAMSAVSNEQLRSSRQEGQALGRHAADH